MRTSSFYPQSRRFAPLLLAAAVGFCLAASLPPARAEPGEAPAKPVTRILEIGQRVESPQRCFLVTPGMYGVREGDRFFELAGAIKQCEPQSNVFLLDWTAAASQKIYGMVVPWLVAQYIGPVADEAAAGLRKLGVDPARTTMIGESFGNYVNSQTAQRLEKVDRIVALNPASEFGGHLTPDLRLVARHSWSVHSDSVFDSRADLADRCLLLATPPGVPAMQLHTGGVAWLLKSIRENGGGVLALDESAITDAPAELYDAVIQPDGRVSPETRRRWLNQDDSPPSIVAAAK